MSRDLSKVIVSPVLFYEEHNRRLLADTVSSLGKTARRSLWLEQRLSRHRKAGQGPQQQDALWALGRTSVCFFFSNYFGCVEFSLPHAGFLQSWQVGDAL